jgi:hypothetical protein
MFTARLWLFECLHTSLYAFYMMFVYCKALLQLAAVLQQRLSSILSMQVLQLTPLDVPPTA